MKKGDRVRLTVRGTEGVHGVALPEYDISVGPVRKGDEIEVELVANKSGEILVACNVYCGQGHAGMRDNLVVTD